MPSVREKAAAITQEKVRSLASCDEQPFRADFRGAEALVYLTDMDGSRVEVGSGRSCPRRCRVLW